MGLIRIDMLCVNVDELYNKPDLYRYMPPAIFNLLEAAYLSGEVTAMIPEADYIHMCHLIILSRNGIKDN